jgi:Gpi18-like mannosyltransferase
MSSFDLHKRDYIIELLAIIIVIKIATFLLSYVSFEIFQKTAPSILELWNRWDTHGYINIAKNGYTNIGDNRVTIVFLPLYPILIRLCWVFIKDYLLSSLIVSNIASVLSVFYFYKLVSKDYSSNVAIRAAFYFLIFPTAYFLSAAYTESLFIFLTIASFYYARDDRWFLAGIFGCMASMTRITGIVLFPALIIEYWTQRKTRIGFKEMIRSKETIFLLLIPLGFVSYIIINYITFGDPLAFLTIQKQQWFKEFSFPWNGFLNTFGGLSWKDPSSRMMTSYAEMIFAIIGLLAVITGFIYLRLSYNIYALLTWLLVTSSGYWLSIPRYMLAIFPLFILLSLAGQRKGLDYLITMMSITFFSLFLIIFAQGWWAF